MKRYLSIILFCICIAGCSLPQPLVRYIAFGDSSTKEYPTYLAQHLAVQTSAVSNQYKSGETSKDGLNRLQNLVAFKTFPNGRVFLYWQGGNDLIDMIQTIDPLLIFDPSSPAYPYTAQVQIELTKIKSNVTQAIALAQSQGWRVYVGTYPKIMPMNCPAIPMIKYLLPGQAEKANKYREMVNASIREAATAHGAFVVDIALYDFSVAQHENCNHLNTSGNQVVAELWADQIKANEGI